MNSITILLAAVKFAAPFTDGAVLQREAKVPVWGVADPGESVTVTFAGQKKTATAAADGHWRVDLDPMPASCEGRVLAANGVVVRDVLVGEVWLCSGQSNMGIPFWGESPRARERLGGSLGQILDLPLLRCAILGNGWSNEPQTAEDVRWRKVTPKFCLTSGFSAVALWYGYYLQTTLKIPVGLLGAYVGATDIETWIPDCTLPPPPARADKDGQKPSQYHNGKVNPIVPYALRGAIWYQGEANTHDPSTIDGYYERMRALLDGWKRIFENPRFKFYFCQLCPWGNPHVPRMQEVQQRFAQDTPDAGMAVLCDVGNLQDIHPNDKQVPGLRLALLALKRDYGHADIVADSPTLKSWKVEDGKFVMTFNDVKAWSVYEAAWGIHKDPTKSVAYGFEVAGADGKWVKAQIGNFRRFSAPWVDFEYRGDIVGEELVVFAPEVKEPKRLRYLHSRPWRGYLMNEAGLPLGAFHIDSPTPPVRTFCNPMVVEDVPLSNFASILPPAERVPHRCLADPTLLRENGKWYLFPSCGQLWRSDDEGGTWRKVEGTGLTKPGHAPTAVKHGGRFLYMPDTTGEVWAAPTVEGPYARLGVIGIKVGGDVPPLCDPMLFSDTDGRLYFYWGCTAQGGIWGVELAKDDPLRPVTEPKELFRFDPQNQPWERVPGRPANGWLEGAWLAKVNGRYVLTYSAAGTQNPEYAMGAYVSDAPLGPFAAAKDNPFLLTTKGLVTGTGHGAIAQDERGDWWAVYCANVGAHARFERLIGFDRLTARADGGFEKASATSEPQWLPGFGKGATGWKRLAVETTAALAADDSLQTAHGFGGLTGTVDYSFAPAEIHATRLVWREDAVDVAKGFDPGPVRYRIEAQTPEGAWVTLVDASQNERDLFVDYRETPVVKAVAARLVVLGASAGIRLGVADWSLFGTVAEAR